MSSKVYLHALTHGTATNGPGTGSVVHFQGCNLGCKGCFSPHTWKRENANMEMSVIELKDALKAVRVVTLSGGEPFQQPAIYEALKALENRPSRVITVYTGYTLGELHDLGFAALLESTVDLLIAGRYRHEHAQDGGVLQSVNQRLIVLNPTKEVHQMKAQLLAKRAVEVLIQPGGETHVTGFPTKELSHNILHVVEGV